MSIDRNEMLQLLKSLPDVRLSELVFEFQFEDTIARYSPPSERAIELIRAVEALGQNGWGRLEKFVLSHLAPQTTSGLDMEAVDHSLLDPFFIECNTHDETFKPHAEGTLEDRSESRRLFLKTRGLAVQVSQNLVLLTDDGVLLCAKKNHIPSTRFHVEVRVDLPNGNLHWLNGPVLLLHREILHRIEPLTMRTAGNPNIRNEFGGEQVVAEYPRVAIIEALTNFLIHRDYTEDDIGRISIFDDRIEFVNPGLSAIEPETLLLTENDLQPKYSRNQRLIEVMSLARLNQRRGSGIKRIRESLEANGSIRPNGGVGLEIWNDEKQRRFHLVIYRRDISGFNNLRPRHSGVFLSCVYDEFEKDGAIFPGLRSQLRGYLARARCDVQVQEEFPQMAVFTVKKLAEVIRPLAVVIHLVGEKLGAIAAPAAVAEYLKAEPRFLANHPDLRAALGDFSGISYTQWEAFIALHHDIPLLVYATDKASAQQTHLDRLLLCRRYATKIKNDAELLGQLIDDLHVILPVVPKFTRKIAGTQLEKHAPRVLFGRETELAGLDAAWANGTLNVFTLVAWGGAGKTSLVFHWVQTRFAAKGWPGVERYFDWSFYSQGTGESRQISADLFIAKALEFFGDTDPTLGGPHERGERLAGLIRQHRTLLILDGIEPLQYPPNDPQAGRLKDPALETLLRELAADNPGLVVITTREHLTNVEGYANTHEQKLDKLSQEAAVAMMRHLAIVGTDEELRAVWRDAGGHALTLSLLSRFIADAYEDRDIRHYREVKFEVADLEHQGRSAFKVMIAYERWLQSGGPDRQRELAVLRLTGLFDRPMAKSCLQALRAEPSIPGLTDTLVKLTPQQWNIAVKRLSELELLSVSPDTLDAHPLIREYFALQLKREQPEAYRAAHSRLFDYLCAATPYRPDGLDGLAPLYEAVSHGCLAGRHQEALDNVYIDRILRGTGSDGFYSTQKLGAIGANLAAVVAFFDEPWSQVSSNLTNGDQAWLLNEAAFSLRALGRLTEALQPMRTSQERHIQQFNWKNAAISSSNLSKLEMTLGQLLDAVSDASQAISLADQSGDTYLPMALRNTLANALHHCGQSNKAGSLYADAERMQKEKQPAFDLLFSLQGFQYCDWLLTEPTRAAWRSILQVDSNMPIDSLNAYFNTISEVERRALSTLEWTSKNRNSLLDIALDHLTLARVGLTRAILAKPLPQPTFDLPHVAAALNGLRASGQMDDLPRGLLTAAVYHFVRGEHAPAEKNLAEAEQIAERGPMPLLLADIYLYRARFVGSLKWEFRSLTEEVGSLNGEGSLQADHVWRSVDPKAELAKAAHLIRTLGYGRRYEELADAEEAAKSWSS